MFLPSKRHVKSACLLIIRRHSALTQPRKMTIPSTTQHCHWIMEQVPLAAILLLLAQYRPRLAVT
jgi:hypothetical protein